MGNFDDTQTYGDWNQSQPARLPNELENHVLAEVLPEFVDVWPLLRGDRGITFDGTLNTLCISDPQECMRYDRILFCDRSIGCRPTAADLLGTQPLNDAGLMASDHFGVQADFRLSHVQSD